MDERWFPERRPLLTPGQRRRVVQRVAGGGPGAVLMWSVCRVVESHAGGAGGCRWCRPDGECRLRDWAADLLVEWERRGRRMPDLAAGGSGGLW